MHSLYFSQTKLNLLISLKFMLDSHTILCLFCLVRKLNLIIIFFSLFSWYKDTDYTFLIYLSEEIKLTNATEVWK